MTSKEASSVRALPAEFQDNGEPGLPSNLREDDFLMRDEHTQRQTKSTDHDLRNMQRMGHKQQLVVRSP